MPTVTNLSSDALNMPSVGGLTLDPGETKPVTDEVATELDGHPLLTVTYDTPAPAPEPAAPPVPPPAPPAEAPAPAAPQE